MKKLLLIGFATGCLSVGFESASCMNSDLASNESTPGANPGIYQALAGIDPHNSHCDLHNQVELFSKLESLTSHMMSQDQSIKDLNDLVTDLKPQSDASEEGTPKSTDVCEQRKLERIRQKEVVLHQYYSLLQQLKIERHTWMEYIDGRKVVKPDFVISDDHNPILRNASEIADFNKRRKQAPHQIQIIDERMSRIRDAIVALSEVKRKECCCDNPLDLLRKSKITH